MGIIAILLAAAAGFAAGAIWYGVLGDRWFAAIGKTRKEARRERSATPFLIAGGGALACSGMMRHVFVSTGIAGAGAGLVAGFGIGAFLVLPWILTNYAFAGRPRDLWWIDGGYSVLAPTMIGLVLGFFG